MMSLKHQCSFRHYIPILKDYPNRYIYEPWNAPLSVQKAAHCVVGVDYPKPMINHAEASRLNIERMKQVYQQLSHYRGLSESPLRHSPCLHGYLTIIHFYLINRKCNANSFLHAATLLRSWLGVLAGHLTS